MEIAMARQQWRQVVWCMDRTRIPPKPHRDCRAKINVARNLSAKPSSSIGSVNYKAVSREPLCTSENLNVQREASSSSIVTNSQAYGQAKLSPTRAIKSCWRLFVRGILSRRERCYCSSLENEHRKTGLSCSLRQWRCDDQGVLQRGVRYWRDVPRNRWRLMIGLHEHTSIN